PVGDPVGAILVEAQLERWAKTEGPFEALDSDKALLNACADRWLAGGDAALAHPYAPEAHQLFAWHFLGEDTARCRYHLAQSRGRMCHSPWGFLENSEKVYRDTLSSHKVIF
ncbi:MAG: hypothetical protein QG622_3532, partial [Actinomycetota bacterium]|nr:hypothetical protein [Actinomycetota bacterium]